MLAFFWFPKWEWDTADSQNFTYSTERYLILSFSLWWYLRYDLSKMLWHKFSQQQSALCIWEMFCVWKHDDISECTHTWKWVCTAQPYAPMPTKAILTAGENTRHYILPDSNSLGTKMLYQALLLHTLKAQHIQKSDFMNCLRDHFKHALQNLCVSYSLSLLLSLSFLCMTPSFPFSQASSVTLMQSDRPFNTVRLYWQSLLSPFSLSLSLCQT